MKIHLIYKQAGMEFFTSEQLLYIQAAGCACFV